MDRYLFCSGLVFLVMGGLSLYGSFEATFGEGEQPYELPPEHQRVFQAVQTLVGIVLVALGLWSFTLLIGGA